MQQKDIFSDTVNTHYIGLANNNFKNQSKDKKLITEMSDLSMLRKSHVKIFANEQGNNFLNNKLIKNNVSDFTIDLNNSPLNNIISVNNDYKFLNDKNVNLQTNNFIEKSLVKEKDTKFIAFEKNINDETIIGTNINLNEACDKIKLKEIEEKLNKIYSKG